MRNIEQKNEKILNTEIVVPNLILLTDWNNYFDYPKLGTLRKLVFNKEKNGFNKVIRKITSRILIDVSAFFQWVDEINGIIPQEQD